MSNDSNTTQRDELAREIFITDNARSEDPAALWDEADHERMHYAEVIADGLIAKGYRKPRTITTAEELDALPEGSIVMADWATHQRILGQWATFGSPATSQPDLPATVLHEPTAEATR